ncbi:MAG TPA: hypothetical protein GXZ96_05370 [Firmicutes bacterium]|jgi:predicted nucleotide-binding protein (sugar kinase/HSP70/actin superfamily)|nr:hypothetical protein [Bacillota bacterium]
MLKVGLPRALLYYQYYPYWSVFFETLGTKVVPSPVTNEDILMSGVQNAVDDCCLPVKCYFGHVLSLQDQVDVLFVPRVVCDRIGGLQCPKILGLPDMVQGLWEPTLGIQAPTVDVRRGHAGWEQGLRAVGRRLGISGATMHRAQSNAEFAQSFYQRALEGGLVTHEAYQATRRAVGLPAMVCRNKQGRFAAAELKIGVLGHPYLIYDPYLSQDLLARLNSFGVTPITAEMVPGALVSAGNARLVKPLFWSLGQRILGAAAHFLDGHVDGVIHLTSFGCGPDSLVGEMIARWARRGKRVPFMSLSFDEHSGEAGLVTRLEAFVDMLKRRAVR